MIQRFFAQQSEWDVLFLDAYADLTDYGDNDTAQVLTRIFVEVLESCISEK